ncbi:MAG: type I 3-dehydroquinate dehydratase [Lachnospiraceae bacterium]|nr:type I 3-dehydroquinate dehydratase [Lachnospiraceae bacterium]
MRNIVEVRGVKIGAGIPKICIPIVGKTKEEIFASANRAKEALCDVAEWRADWFDEVFDFAEVEMVLQKLRAILAEIPLLVTFRTKKEGGEKAISPEDYVIFNQKVIKTGYADLVDAEAFLADGVLEKIVSEAHSFDVKVIASNHDFFKTPQKEELLSRIKEMEARGADIAKIAVMPENKKDVFTLLAATECAAEEMPIPVITMSMGGIGLLSRLSGEIFGSALTFGTAGVSSAPGQMDAVELRRILTLIHTNSEKGADK